MAAPSKKPMQPGRSKTELRRGHLTPGQAALPAKPAACPDPTSTAEQALLFDLSHEEPRSAKR